MRWNGLLRVGTLLPPPLRPQRRRCPTRRGRGKRGKRCTLTLAPVRRRSDGVSGITVWLHVCVRCSPGLRRRLLDLIRRTAAGNGFLIQSMQHPQPTRRHHHTRPAARQPAQQLAAGRAQGFSFSVCPTALTRSVNESYVRRVVNVNVRLLALNRPSSYHAEANEQAKRQEAQVQTPERRRHRLSQHKPLQTRNGVTSQKCP